MYTYKFYLKFSKRKTAMNFDKCAAIIEKAIDAINTGITFKRDGKRFHIDERKQDSLTLVLTSNNSLTNPSRSISALTRYLTTYHNELFKDSIFNKTLFSIELVSQEQIAPSSPRELSNEELLKGMVDLLYGYTATSNSETLARNEAIQQIKLLAAPYIRDN